MNKEVTTTHRRRSYCRTASPPRQAEESPRNRVLVGDALEQLAQLPAASVDAVVTSPPYHLLRRYGGGKAEIGTETRVDDYVAHIVAVCRELARVLKPTGCLWLNLGDSYSRHHRYGAPTKSLLLAPERILLDLSADGWIVRSKVIWHKSNHLPASVQDRLTMAWEPLYFLTRQRRYYFDLDAIRVPHLSTGHPSKPKPNGYDATKPQWAGPMAGSNDGLMRAHAAGRVGHPLGKNPGDVWRLPTANFRGAHFAVFPERLVEPAIKASVPKRVCRQCRSPWRHAPGIRDAPLKPACTCRASWRPGLVLDPFMGSGTVGVVARRLSRDWLGIELNLDFARLATQRIATTRPGGSDATTPEGGDAHQPTKGQRI